MTRRDERGVATPMAVGLMGVLLTLTLGCVAAASGVATHRQAQADADLVALAAASAVGRGQDACSVAASIARRNHASLGRCTLQGFQVEVEVSAPTSPVLARLVGRTDLPARARAGPVGDGDLSGLAPAPVPRPGCRPACAARH